MPQLGSRGGSTEDRKVLAALLASALIGAVVGAASAILVVSSRTPDVPVPGDGEALEREMRALRNALTDAVPRFEDLAERGQSPQLAEPATLPREPAGDPGRGDVDALFAGLDERLARLEEILAQVRAPSAGPRIPGERRGTPDFPPKGTVTSREFRDDHLFWDYARMSERYGLPDHIYAREGSVRWVYELNDGREIDFTFVNGIVIAAVRF